MLSIFNIILPSVIHIKPLGVKNPNEEVTFCVALTYDI